jgi:hypothetical protein
MVVDTLSMNAIQISIQQIDRPPALRRVGELHVPCECGRPLVGVEAELLTDAEGWSLHTTGVCLVCGRQSAFYVSTPGDEPAGATTVRDEVEAIVESVLRLRATSEPD